jgi:hypothetical protein
MVLLTFEEDDTKKLNKYLKNGSKWFQIEYLHFSSPFRAFIRLFLPKISEWPHLGRMSFLQL